MASESEYLQAIGRVASGTATSSDHDLCQRAAQQAGSLGNKARAALAGK
jgi:hypothetical protein